MSEKEHLWSLLIKYEIHPCIHIMYSLSVFSHIMKIVQDEMGKTEVSMQKAVNARERISLSDANLSDANAK